VLELWLRGCLLFVDVYGHGKALPEGWVAYVGHCCWIFVCMLRGRRYDTVGLRSKAVTRRDWQMAFSISHKLEVAGFSKGEAVGSDRGMRLQIEVVLKISDCFSFVLMSTSKAQWQ